MVLVGVCAGISFRSSFLDNSRNRLGGDLEEANMANIHIDTLHTFLNLKTFTIRKQTSNK